MYVCVTTIYYTVYRDLLATDKIWQIGEFQKIAKLNNRQNFSRSRRAHNFYL